MKVLIDIKELLEEELKTIRKKGTVTPAELDSVHKAVETMKLIDEMCEMECDKDEYEGEYSGKIYNPHLPRYSGSRGNRWMIEGPMYPEVYNDGYSYGRSSNGYSGCNTYSGARHRDSMGRYSSYGHDRMGMDHMYSRDSATAHMIEKLERMYDEATTEKERQAIRTCIDYMSW